MGLVRPDSQILVGRQNTDSSYTVRAKERKEEWGIIITIEKSWLRKEDRDETGMYDGKYLVGPGGTERTQIVLE